MKRPGNQNRRRLARRPSERGVKVHSRYATVFLLAPLGVPPAVALSLAFAWFATFTVASLGGVGFYLGGRFPRVAISVRQSTERRRRDPI